jgi:RimJ/RimL family protein N-acetyltransferase
MPPLVTPALSPGSMAKLTQPVLTTGDLMLRPWLLSDGPDVVDAYSDPGIQRWHAKSMTASEARDWIAAWSTRWLAETGAGWAVIRGSAQVIGQISLRTIDLTEGLAEFSYWVTPDARGRGVAPAAVSAVSQWAVQSLQLHRLEIAHSTQNPPSCRVAQRAGFDYEGTKRSEALHADGWHDMHLHALIKQGDDRR